MWKELTLRVSSDYDECEPSDHGSGQISCCNACMDKSAPSSPHLGLQKKTNTFKCLARQKYIHAFSHSEDTDGLVDISIHRFIILTKLTELGPKFMVGYFFHMPNKCAYKAPLHFLYDLK